MICRLSVSKCVICNCLESGLTWGTGGICVEIHCVTSHAAAMNA